MFPLRLLSRLLSDICGFCPTFLLDYALPHEDVGAFHLLETVQCRSRKQEGEMTYLFSGTRTNGSSRLLQQLESTTARQIAEDSFLSASSGPALHNRLYQPPHSPCDNIGMEVQIMWTYTSGTCSFGRSSPSGNQTIRNE